MSKTKQKTDGTLMRLGYAQRLHHKIF